MTKDLTKNFKKLVNNRCTSEELEEVMAMIYDDQYADVYASLIARELAMPVASEEIDAGLRDRLDLRLKEILRDEKPVKDLEQRGSKVQKLWLRIAVTAAAVAVVTLGIWIYEMVSWQSVFHNNNQINSAKLVINDIPPGKNRATLTLANGQSIPLSDAKTGVFIDATSFKYNDGTDVTSSSRGGTEANRNKLLLLSTPRGGTYQVVLPDGTRVWLNADSKISFPSRFSGKTRNVQLSGEAYLEVAKDKSRPFFVQSRGQSIEVLGTHFNFNNYADDGTTKTTLLEGSVKVVLAANGLSKLLTPGHQAVNQAGNIRIREIKTDLVVAWKNNNFTFERQTIQEIMPMLARWYNVEIIYEGAVPTDTFWGSVSRFEHISKVLEVLQATENVKFKIEGRKVIVTK